MKKYLVGLLIMVSLVVPGVYISAQTVDVAALQAQIAQLQALIAQIQGQQQPNQCYQFTSNLTIGSTGADVTELQKVLVAKGYLVMPSGVAYGSFDLLVQVAVANWQVAAGISPATGYVGPVSRAALNYCPPTTVGSAPVITRVSDTLTTEYNSALPSSPYLVSTHQFRIKANNRPVYIGENILARLINSSGQQQGNSFADHAVVTNAPRYTTVLAAGVNSWVINSGQEYTFTLTTKWNSNQIFRGSYYSRLNQIAYWLNPNDITAEYVSVNGSTPTIAVVGETAPYISSITQDGDIITINGVRFDDDVTVKIGDKMIPAKITSGSVGGERKITISQKWFNLPNASQQFSVSDAKGDSNIVYFRVGGDTSNIGSISNVRMTDKSGNNDSGVEQGTNISIAWDTTEKNTIEKVDVLVCWLVSGKENCAISYPKLVNSGKADSVFVWKNVPTGLAYVKVRKAGVDSISGRTADFRVISQPSGGATVKVITPNGGEVYNQNQTLTYRIEVKSPQSSISGEIFLHDRYGATVKSLGGFDKGVEPTTGMSVYQATLPLSSVNPGMYKIQSKINSGSQTIYDETDGLFEVKIPTVITPTATYHEADTNKDQRIIVSELTAYASKVGQYNSSLNIASEIWKKGETYSFNSTSGFYLDAQGKEVYFLLGSKVDNLESNTWTQGQRKSVSWHQPVTGVDVLVCKDDTKQCFYAFKNISGGSVSGVLVASNIPATSGTTKKYAYIKVQKSDNPQHAVISEKFEVIAPVATTQTSSSILGIQAILDGIQSSLNAQ